MHYKVLLADDSATIQKLVEMALCDSDFQLLSVSDGEQAVEQLESYAPDIILADAIMPKMDGYEVCQYVRNSATFSKVPVILLTGRFQPFDKDRADQVGISEKVVKPFSQDLLISVMREQLAAVPPAVASGSAVVLPPADMDDTDFETRAFDEGATIAISPDQLRAQLQQIDHLTASQEEEIPSIDDFQLDDEESQDNEAPTSAADDDDRENATVAFDPNSLASPVALQPDDLDALDLDDFSASDVEELPEAAMEDLEDLPEADIEDLPEAELLDPHEDFEALSSMEAEQSESDLAPEPLSFDADEASDRTEDLDATEMIDFQMEEETPASADLPEFEEDTEPLSLSERLGDDELDPIHLEDHDEALDFADHELHDESLEELDADDFHFEDEEPSPQLSGPDDTQPISTSAPAVDAEPEASEWSDDSFGEQLPPPEEAAELELELEDGFEEGPKSDENAVLDLEDADDFGFDGSDGMADTIAMTEPFSADAFSGAQDTLVASEPLVSSTSDFDDTVRSDVPLASLVGAMPSADQEESDFELDAQEAPAEPESDFVDLSDDAFDAADDIEEVEEVAGSDEPAAEPFDSWDQASEEQMDDDTAEEQGYLVLRDKRDPFDDGIDDADLSLADEDEDLPEDPFEEPAAEPLADAPQDALSDMAATIRVDEPVIQPEEAAYFADTIRVNEPLVSREPEQEADSSGAMAGVAAATAVMASAAAAATPVTMTSSGSLVLDEAQMEVLAGKVVNELIKRLGTEEIRDIVWQVVPELAEAMIKKRIYQLEQSVDAE